MPPRAAALHTSRTFHATLLASVSALALLTAGAPASALQLATARGGAGSASAAAAAAMASVQQAQTATQQSMSNLLRATQAVQAMQQAQTAARALAQSAASSVPNGLAPGGLVPTYGLGSFTPQNPDPDVWYGANAPTQSVSNGQTDVEVDQTQQKAILTWTSFNVGKTTTLYFNQSAGNQTDGNNDWIALNRVIDPSGVPSQILGQIKAEGTVYLINANGIIFGGTSQINVHTLVASSLGFLGENIAGLTPGSSAYDAIVGNPTIAPSSTPATGTDTNWTFVNSTGGGIAAPEATGSGSAGGKGNLVLGVGTEITSSAASSYVTPGPISIEPGASITTQANGAQSDGGFVLIAAPSIDNDGTIATPDGQAILAAGIGVSLLQNISTTSAQLLIPELTGLINVNGQDVTPVGSLVNNGLIQATTGNITLLGTNVSLGGAVEVTTSVSTPGSITISTVDEAETGDVAPNVPADRRAGQLNISGILANLPEDDGQSVPSDSTTFVAGSLNLTAGSVWLENGSLIEAPGASVSVTALTPTQAGDNTPPGDTAVQGRIYVDNGATVDVAGLANVELPMSDTLVTIGPITANDLADSPLQRTSFLLGQTIVVDSTISGTSADGEAWVGTPIVDAEGYVEDIPRSIDQLLTNGGSITLSGNEVMTASGSSLNLDGGYVHYLGGTVTTTRLIDASGALINIADADPDDTYVGVAGQFSIDHAHWGVTQNFTESLLDGSYYEPDYIAGGNAGTLSVFGTQAVVLDGAMTAQAFPGLKQEEAGLAPSGTSAGGNYLPDGGSFVLGAATTPTAGSGGALSGEAGSVIVQNEAPDLDDLQPGFGAETPLDTSVLNALGANDPNNILDWTTVPAVPLNNGGFANVTVDLETNRGGQIVVAQGTTLVVQPGGAINLKAGGAVDVLGNLIAPAGTISIAIDTFLGGDNITIGSGATLSVAGEWINDGNVGDLTAGDTTFINGGSVSLSTSDAAANNVDGTGSIILEKGSVIDLASGGVLLPGDTLLNKSGIPEGKGGSLSLLTYYDPTTGYFGAGEGAPSLPNSQPTAGQIVMDGTIDSFGFSGGGTLTLQALGFQIGGDPSTAPGWALYLPADFFASQGFGKYQLNVMYDATVAPGTIVLLTQQNLIPNVAALAQAATGADLSANGLTSLGTIDPYDRQATNLVITADGYLRWSGTTTGYSDVTDGLTIGAGASIDADAGASIGLGSPMQVTVLGSIIAPGGSIILSGDSGTSTYGFAQPGQAPVSYTSPGKSVWLGADAVLDVAGVALTDPFAAPERLGVPTTGKVLDGGSVVLSDDSGTVVAQAGAVIDVSGVSATFDEAQGTTSSLAGVDYVSQQVWSDAGSITLAASGGLYFDGTLKAYAGAPQGEGGTLTIQPETGSVTTTQPDGTSFTMPGATAVVFEQSDTFVPAGLTPGEAFTSASANAPTGTLQFAVDRLQGSGVSTLVIGGAVNAAGAEQAVVPVGFAGNVNLSLARAVEINTQELFAVDATQLADILGGTSLSNELGKETGSVSIGAPVISISAPYVEIGAPGGVGAETLSSQTAALADAVLDVNAGFIDLEDQFSLENFGEANFVSSGDIRLSSTITAGVTTNTFFPGELYTPGNLTFAAADLYPASGESFILDASGSQPTTITFENNGPSSVPLSAGGTLLVDATNIVQAGTIRAPSGTIVLGVGDKSDTTTQTAFASLPLVDTQSVMLASGSVTSVSLDGTSIPYGTTTDGLDWQYSEIAGDTTDPDLTAPPAKVITINGSNVSLNSGATIDLSGGGDLYATEWVAGTGGSRNVLAQYNVTYPASGAAVATPLYPDARNVYAIVPSYEAPVAAYDPVYAQVTQPATNANGTPTTQTETIGVGAAAINAQVGQAVYLSGVPGLPAGTYVLLPAQYATLPGAYRVVENTGASNVVPGQSVTLPDGTHLVSGYYVDALSGARSATPVQFEVQSAAVWGQYSQYTLTSANTYFASQAESNGTATPPLPMDAGDLTLAATNSLILNTTLEATAAAGGLPAEVNIASQDIEIVGQGEQALAGYLQISADSLDALGAGSLLIGGTRTATTDGVTIDAIADSVVVANDANDPLTGPEIILVTTTDPTHQDANSGNGLLVESGSVIEARGSLPASADQPITIGSSTISGDGALLRVSNAGQVDITRDDLPANAIGALTVEAGANIEGGAALTLDSSGNLSFAPTATFSATNIAVDAPAITLTSATGSALSGLQGFVVGPQNLGQFASAEQVDLRSYGAIIFDGNVNLTFGQDVELSAGAFESNGGTVDISAPTVAFSNDLGATEGTAAGGSASLDVNANEIDLGTGAKALSGFGTVAFNATGGLVGQNSGSFDMGAANVTLAAPIYVADTSSETSLTTTGALVLNSNSGTALALNPVGGAISFTGGSLAVNGATIEAPAGNVSLEATGGNLTLASGSLVSSQGVSKLFFDVTEYAPAGNITLTADEGAINVAQGATLNFASAQGGGAAGTLTLSAPVETVNLNGTILGGAASGYQGGSFSLNTGGSVDLDNLATELAQSGVTESITVETNQGNLILSAGNSLTAHVVSLTADGGTGDLTDTSTGNVVIDGLIDAIGVEGGEIDLYGKNNVDIEGTLFAIGLSSTEQGGTVNLGTAATFNPNAIDPATNTTNPYNATYGYENVFTSGGITLGANALINVSGGTAGGLSGGTVNFRAPLLADGNVNINVTPGAQIIGSRATTLEAYAVWSTTDSTTGAQHFDGIVDPAGWYTSSGTLVAGTFTEQSTSSTPPTFTFTPDANGDGGGTVTNTTTNVTTALTQQQVESGDSTIGFGGLQNDYFTPTSVNTDHQAFYGYQSDGTTPGTLMGFVENLPISASVASRFTDAGVQNFAVTPGIELDNPSAAINNGNISILTNWNLGAGTSSTDLAYRYQGEAPVITFRAENDVKVDASLSDGFFQVENPTGSGVSILVPAASTFAQQEYALYTNPNGYALVGYYIRNYGSEVPFAAPQQFTSGDSGEVGQYYGLYSFYLNFLEQNTTQAERQATYFSTFPAAEDIPIAQLFVPFGRNLHTWLSAPVAAGQPTLTVSYPTGAAADDASNYLRYVEAYGSYLVAEENFEVTTGVTPNLQPILPPPAVLDPVLPNTPIVITPAAVDNSPSPTANAGNVLPLLYASLNGGSSSSFQIVAGANLNSANPLALQAAGASSGSVTLDDHVSYVDSNGQTINTPTMIRTGTGSIDIAAANDVSLLDTAAPGVIYTAGEPANGTTVGETEAIVSGNQNSGGYDLLVTDTVNPDAAGNVSIIAQGNITGVENVNGVSGGSTGYLNSQFWWQWMEITPEKTISQNNVTGAWTETQITQTSIDFGAFDQGVMSVGGNVSISAGGNITNLAASVPATWYLSNGTPVTVGGGNLTVTAGGNILSGDYFVANGTSTLSAGGLIGSSGLTYGGSEVSTILAAQNGVFNVSAVQGVDIGAVVDPSYLQGGTLLYGYGVHADAQSYSASSALNVVSTTGSVALNTLLNPTLIGAAGTGSTDDAYVLPASVNLLAFSGGIAVDGPGELYPSASGQLSLIAAQSIALTNANASGSIIQDFGLIDASVSALPSPTNAMPVSIVGVTNEFFGNLTSNAPLDHSQTALHANDSQPVLIYSLDGSITDGSLNSDGNYANLLQIAVDKPAEIEAGENILNLAFLGQNLRDDDITSIIAGRDIDDSTNLAPANNFIAPALVLGGPGTFDIEAGRNIGPLTNQQYIYDIQGVSNYDNPTTGIDAIGNADDPFLPHESASVQVLFGVGPGIDYTDFIADYLDPATAIPYALNGTWQLTNEINQTSVTLTPAQLWALFETMTPAQQKQEVLDAFFAILAETGSDYNNSASPYYHQYANGYEAINTLFPASYGYTANSLDGGSNGANKLVDTGNLDIRSTTIQTQQGGNVSILGPGGEALIGSSSAPPEIVYGTKVEVGPGAEGILTLESGNVDIFTDQSLLLAQSRVFTEEGGDMTIWSSNGDINAGKGAKTVTNVPAPIYVSDEDHYNTRDARGEVSGAGISTVAAIPGVPPGNVNLIAPRGTIDAGAAGIRVSGNLNIAALQVLNAFNIQVQGVTTGVPTVVTPNVGSLSDASAASGAATKAITSTEQGNAAAAQPSILIVEIEGYGGDDSDENTPPAPDRSKNLKHQTFNDQPEYNDRSAVQIAGYGTLSDGEAKILTPEEKEKLSRR